MNLGPANPTICTGDSVLLDAGPGWASYAWSTGASLSSIYANDSISYIVTVTNAPYNCATIDTVVPIIDADCVWPGDANHDYIVDAIDFLDIGVAFGFTGSIRNNASTNWVGQPATNWPTALLSGQNHKHADTDGDGIVDFADTVAINMYQGNIHARVGEITTGVPLHIWPRIPLFAGQDSVELIVDLGTAGIPADSAYGLTFTLDYDAADVYAGVGGKPSNSFMGNVGTQVMGMDAESGNFNQYLFAMVKVDHQLSHGFGEVARIKLQARPSLWTHQTRVLLPISVSNIRLIRPDGSDMAVTAVVDSVLLYDNGYVATADPNRSFAWSISPNPADAALHLRIDPRLCGPYQLNLIDQSGKVIGQQSGHLTGCSAMNEVEFSTAAFLSGVYALQLQTQKWTVTSRVVILH